MFAMEIFVDSNADVISNFSRDSHFVKWHVRFKIQSRILQQYFYLKSEKFTPLLKDIL